MSAIEIVKGFYNSDVANDATLVSTFFHKDCELHWTSSQGFQLLNYSQLQDFFEHTRRAFDNLRFEFTHLIEVDATVVTRHTLFGSAMEDANNETVLGHFSTIWEVKDGKLYRGYEISQQADESDTKSMQSFAKRNL